MSAARPFLAAALLWLLALAATAQEAATLVADSVRLTQDRALIAEGNVEILQGTTRLTAARVTYDGEADRLKLEGPLVLRDGESTVILADSAELSQGLRDGILRGARLVLDQQLQIAAVEIQRVGGRYSQALKVGATSCHVCASGRPPLWQIRARRIVHDQLERQLYFDEAQLQILGVPVLWVPRLRLPDPSLERATGFLVPELSSSSRLGNGFKLPYFIVLGESADLTVTPFLTTNTRTIELRYRQAFAAGEIEWNTYTSRDEFGPDEIRWGVLADARFDVAAGFELRFDIEAASDRSYLSEYNYSDKDRLDSAVSLTRTRRDTDTEIELVGIRSLRDGEANSTFPSVIFDARHDMRFAPQGIGGDARLRLSFHGHSRNSSSRVDGDGDGISDGLDVLRAGAALDWQREWLAGAGFLFGAQAAMGGDVYWLNDDSLFDDRISRGRAGAAVSLRWPLLAVSPRGTRHVLEPKVQLAYTTTSDVALPNEDSTRVEFDEGSLFALNRAPGYDVVEEGTRLDLGLSWTRQSPAGWDSSLSVGRVERLSGDTAFTLSSGLSDASSGWVIAGSLQTPGAYDVIGRILLDSDLSVIKNDLRFGYTGERFRAATSFAYLAADIEEDRGNAASELAVSTEYDLTAGLTGLLDWRYDFTSDTTTEAEIGLRYFNECVEVALSVSRSFTSSASVTPSTEFALTVGLRGFGTGAQAKHHAASCR